MHGIYNIIIRYPIFPIMFVASYVKRLSKSQENAKKHVKFLGLKTNSSLKKDGGLGIK